MTATRTAIGGTITTQPSYVSVLIFVLEGENLEYELEATVTTSKFSDDRHTM